MNKEEHRKTNLWRFKPTVQGKLHPRFKMMMENNLVSIGQLPVKNFPSNADDYVHQMHNEHGDSLHSSIATFALNVNNGDYIWMRNDQNQFWLGLVTSDWAYTPDPELNENQIYQFRKCHWVIVNEIPKNIESHFESRPSFQRISTEKENEKKLDETIELYETYFEKKLAEHEQINDSKYITEANKCELSDKDLRDAELAHLMTVEKTTASKSKTYPRDPRWGKIAIKNNNYQCELGDNHQTFTSHVTNKNFVEAHHLIPMNEYETYGKKNNINIDCPKNIVPLCPNCHRQVHHATNSEKQEILEILYEKRKKSLHDIGIKITLSELLNSYGITTSN